MSAVLRSLRAAAQALMTLRETSRDAFFGLLLQRLETVLPLIYTPTVAEACQRWSTLLHRPTGLYVSTQDKARLLPLIS